MANKGEISVELRLRLDKLRGDVKKAAQVIWAGLSVTVGDKSAAPVEKTAQAFEKVAVSAKKATAAVNENKKAMFDAWRASLPAPKVTFSGGRSVGADPWVNPVGSGAQTSLGAYPGTSTGRPRGVGAPPAVFTQQAAQPGQSIASVFNSIVMKPLNNVGAAFAKANIYLAAFRLALNNVRYVVDTLLAPLRALWAFVSAAAMNARTMYTRGLSSGMGLGYSIRRQVLAEVIGVSENEVYSYAQAVGSVTDRVQYAVAAFRHTTPQLTATAFEIKAFQVELQSLWSQFAMALSPVVRTLINELRLFIPLLGTMAEDLGNMVRAALALSAAAGGIAIGNIPGAVAAAMAAIQKTTSSAPQPGGASARLPTSAWERMGLVLSAGGATNWERDTAKNTAATARLLLALNEKFSALKGQPKALGWLNTTKQ